MKRVKGKKNGQKKVYTKKKKETEFKFRSHKFPKKAKIIFLGKKK